MNGTIFTWGSDPYGQLGISYSSGVAKVLYPRMVLELRDEIVKEICCGHSHTLVTNIHGQVFVWGKNEEG